MQTNIDTMAKILWSGATVNYGATPANLTEAKKQSIRQKAALRQRFGDLKSFVSYLTNQPWVRLLCP